MSETPVEGPIAPLTDVQLAASLAYFEGQRMRAPSSPLSVVTMPTAALDDVIDAMTELAKLRRAGRGGPASPLPDVPSVVFVELTDEYHRTFESIRRQQEHLTADLAAYCEPYGLPTPLVLMVDGARIAFAPKGPQRGVCIVPDEPPAVPPEGEVLAVLGDHPADTAWSAELDMQTDYDTIIQPGAISIPPEGVPFTFDGVVVGRVMPLTADDEDPTQ